MVISPLIVGMSIDYRILIERNIVDISVTLLSLATILIDFTLALD